MTIVERSTIENRGNTGALPATVRLPSSEWTGEKLHKIWSESSSKSPAGRPWPLLHRWNKEKWNELAKAVNSNIIWI